MSRWMTSHLRIRERDMLRLTFRTVAADTHIATEHFTTSKVESVHSVIKAHSVQCVCIDVCTLFPTSERWAGSGAGCDVWGGHVRLTRDWTKKRLSCDQIAAHSEKVQKYVWTSFGLCDELWQARLRVSSRS